MLRSLTSFFFLTENYSICINRPVRGPRMMPKVCFKGCGYPGGIRAR